MKSVIFHPGCSAFKHDDMMVFVPQFEKPHARAREIKITDFTDFTDFTDRRGSGARFRGDGDKIEINPMDHHETRPENLGRTTGVRRDDPRRYAVDRAEIAHQCSAQAVENQFHNDSLCLVQTVKSDRLLGPTQPGAVKKLRTTP